MCHFLCMSLWPDMRMAGDLQGQLPLYIARWGLSFFCVSLVVVSRGLLFLISSQSARRCVLQVYPLSFSCPLLPMLHYKAKRVVSFSFYSYREGVVTA